MNTIYKKSLKGLIIIPLFSLSLITFAQPSVTVSNPKLTYIDLVDFPTTTTLEFPPSQITGGSRTYFLTNGPSVNYTHSTWNLADNPSNDRQWDYDAGSYWEQVTHTPEIVNQSLNKIDPFWITGEDWVDSLSLPEGEKEAPHEETDEGSVDYRVTDPYQSGTVYPLPYARHYNGAVGAHVVYSNLESQFILLTINHGENYNAYRDEFPPYYHYDNTLTKEWIPDPSDPDADEYYAMDHSEGNRLNTSYSGFVTASLEFYDQSHSWGMSGNEYWSLGPIAWPANGYMDENENHIGLGLRHPSSIITNLNGTSGYLYTYFTDTSTQFDNSVSSAGKKYGVKSVRAPVKDADNPQMYKVFHNGNWNSSSIPSNLDPYTIWDNSSDIADKDFLETEIPSDVVIGDNNTFRFSPSRLAGTNYYLGVEHRAGWIYVNQNNDVWFQWDESLDGEPQGSEEMHQASWLGETQYLNNLSGWNYSYGIIVLWISEGLADPDWNLVGVLHANDETVSFDNVDMKFPIFLDDEGNTNSSLYDSDSDDKYECMIIASQSASQTLSRYAFELEIN